MEIGFAYNCQKIYTFYLWDQLWFTPDKSKPNQSVLGFSSVDSQGALETQGDALLVPLVVFLDVKGLSLCFLHLLTPVLSDITSGKGFM